MALCIGVAANGGIHAGNANLTLMGASNNTIGLATAAQAFGICLAAPLFLGISRGTSGARMTAIFTALILAGLAAVLELHDFTLHLIARLVLGMGVGLGMAHVEYVLVASVRPGARAYFAAAFGIVLAMGHVLGSLAADQLFAPYLLPIVCGLFAAAALPFMRAIAAPTVIPIQTVRDTLSMVAGFPMIFSAAFIFGLLDNGFLSILPNFFSDLNIGREAMIQTSFAAFLGILALQFPASWLSQRMEPQRLLRIAVLALVVAIIFMVDFSGWAMARNVAGFAVGGLTDVIYTVGLIYIATAMPLERQASASACFVSLCGVGEFFGPLITGSALTVAGGRGAFMLLLLVLMIYWLMLTESRTKQRSACIDADVTA